MLLDVIIDPVAHLGEQWFLGKIYYYANPGWYFDVPLSNFAGWFLVAATVIFVNEIIWKFFHMTHGSCHTTKKLRLCVAFYTSIALFNIIVTFWIGAWVLGICSSVFLLVILALLKKCQIPKLN